MGWRSSARNQVDTKLDRCYKQGMGYTVRSKTVRTIGACRKCGKVHIGEILVVARLPDSDEPWRGGRPPLATSTERAGAPIVCCERHVAMQRVQGRKTDHVCDVRCTEAKGHKCECSCGGANHGAGHASAA
jgi:hypothetical protein